MEYRNNLVDISTVNVDTSLPKDKRIKEFRHQMGGNIKNFMCCGVEVTASFADTDLTLEQCVLGIII